MLVNSNTSLFVNASRYLIRGGGLLENFGVAELTD